MKLTTASSFGTPLYTDGLPNYPPKTIHTNPSLANADDGLYNPTKKIKTSTDALNEPVQNCTIGNPKLASLISRSLQPSTYGQMSNQLFIQSLFKKALIEQELARYYQSLLEWSSLHALNNYLRSIDTSYFSSLASLPAFHNEIPKNGGLKSFKKQTKKKKPRNKDVIVINDDEAERSQKPEQNIKEELIIVETNKTPFPRGFSKDDNHFEDIKTILQPDNYCIVEGDQNAENSSMVSTEITVSVKCTKLDAGTIIEDTKSDPKIEEIIQYSHNISINNVEGVQESHEHHVVKTPVGTNHQALVPPFNLNRTRNRRRTLKAVWRPDTIDNEKFDQYVSMLESTLSQTISNQEMAAKLLVKSGLDVTKIVSAIEKNKIFYKNYFDSNQRALRKRQYST